MEDTPQELDLTTLKRDVHGERVADAHRCDYCGGTVEVDQPVQYELIRVVDMPNLEQLFTPPPGWFADAIRCRTCETEGLAPASDGFAEALVVVELAESNGVLSIDTSSTTVVDFSPDGDGYYPPKIAPRLIAQSRDFGLARWIRVKWLLDHDDGSSSTVAMLRTAAEQSREIPPSVPV